MMGGGGWLAEKRARERVEVPGMEEYLLYLEDLVDLPVPPSTHPLSPSSRQDSALGSAHSGEREAAALESHPCPNWPVADDGG